MPRASLKSEIAEIFAYWQEIMAHPRARLDNARRQKIAARLREGYTVTEIKNAILGCKQSDFHQGDNKSGTIYDDITLICRSGSKLEQFIGYLRAKPRRSRDSWLDVGRSSGSSETSHPLDPGSTCLDCKGTGLIDSQPDNPGFVPNRTFTPCRACSFTPP